MGDFIGDEPKSSWGDGAHRAYYPKIHSDMIKVLPKWDSYELASRSKFKKSLLAMLKQVGGTYLLRNEQHEVPATRPSGAGNRKGQLLNTPFTPRPVRHSPTQGRTVGDRSTTFPRYYGVHPRTRPCIPCPLTQRTRLLTQRTLPTGWNTLPTGIMIGARPRGGRSRQHCPRACCRKQRCPRARCIATILSYGRPAIYGRAGKLGHSRYSPTSKRFPVSQLA
jgi:hypothetical protein